MLDPCRTLSTDAGQFPFLKWQACFAFVRSDLASPWGLQREHSVLTMDEIPVHCKAEGVHHEYLG